jgi:hypothetical protein
VQRHELALPQQLTQRLRRDERGEASSPRHRRQRYLRAAASVACFSRNFLTISSCSCFGTGE